MQSSAAQDGVLQARVGRLRNRVDTLSDFSGRHDPAPESITDDLFVQALTEATEDLGIHKEDIADRLGTSSASIYRWLNNKNLPQPLLIPVILKELATLARARADEIVDEFLELRNSRAGTVPIRGSLYQEGLPIVDTGAEPLLISSIGADTLGSQIGPERPTFAAFDWRGRPGDGAVLTPAMAVTEAHLLVCTPGLEIFDHRQNKFVEVVPGAGGIADVVLFAADSGSPVIPEIRLRARSGSASDKLAWGRLILCSEFGVPVTMSGNVASFHRARSANEEETSRADLFETRFAEGPDWKHGFSALLNEGVGRDEFETYEHGLALQNRNFEIWHDSALYALQWKRRRQDKSLRSTLMNRYVVFDREKSRPTENVIYLATHFGREVLLPLCGLVAAHLVDRTAAQRRIANENRREFGLAELLQDGAAYSPLFFGSGRARVPEEAEHAQLILLDPSKTLHGFSAVSRWAVMLHISVKEVGSSSEWRALSQLEPDSRVQVA